MAVYCSRCGYRQERPMPYCPSCGTKMAASGNTGSVLPANVGPYAAAPRDREPETRYVGVFLFWSILALVIVGGFFVRAGTAPTCQQAEQTVEQHHAFIFGAMSAAGLSVTLNCANFAVNPITAARYASADWTYQGTKYSAAYWVNPTGAVSPANLTAGELDRAASSGVNALLSLLR